MTDPVTVMYLMETSPQKVRGSVTSLLTGVRPLGGVLGSAIANAALLGRRSTWGVVFLLMGLPSVVGPVIFYLLPESPKLLLIQRGDLPATLRSLAAFNVPKEDVEVLLESFRYLCSWQFCALKDRPCPPPP